MQDNIEPLICVFGFDINPNDGECHLTVNIAGKVENNDINLLIICPRGYIYSGSGKLCKKSEFDGRSVIDFPVICPPGYQPDKKGYCRSIW